MKMTTVNSTIVFHKEIRECDGNERDPEGRVFISQNYFDPLDPFYVNEDGDQVDKYVTDEFLGHKEYGCQVNQYIIFYYH